MFSSFHLILEAFDLARCSGDSLNLLSLRAVKLRPLDDQRRSLKTFSNQEGKIQIGKKVRKEKNENSVRVSVSGQGSKSAKSPNLYTFPDLWVFGGCGFFSEHREECESKRFSLTSLLEIWNYTK